MTSQLCVYLTDLINGCNLVSPEVKIFQVFLTAWEERANLTLKSYHLFKSVLKTLRSEKFE